MNKPSDYDALTLNNYRELPPGGYVARVLKAEERQTGTGKPMLVVALDICDGEYSNYFMNLFRDRKKNSQNPLMVKYPNGGMAYIVTLDSEGKTRRQFKSFTTSIEESGGHIVWGDGFCKSIEGATVGVLFGREEYEGNDGKNHWTTKPFFFRSVDRILEGDWTVPDDRPLQKNTYTPTNSFSSEGMNSLFGDAPVTELDNFNAAQDDIPF